jgi:hypothetical protein
VEEVTRMLTQPGALPPAVGAATSPVT